MARVVLCECSEGSVVRGVEGGWDEAGCVVRQAEADGPTVGGDVARADAGVDECAGLGGHVVELLASELAYEGDDDVGDAVDVEGHGEEPHLTGYQAHALEPAIVVGREHGQRRVGEQGAHAGKQAAPVDVRGVHDGPVRGGEKSLLVGVVET